MQPCCTPFPIWNQSVFPCPVLSVASCTAYRFFRRQVRWSGIPISLRIFDSLLWSTQSKALHSQWSRSRCISGILLLFLWENRYWQFDLWFSAFSKFSLNIYKFSVHALLRPGLENFEHCFASMWDKCNYAVVWIFFSLPSFGIWMKTDFFQSCGHCWVFQVCWHIKCSTFTSTSFRIWNSSDGIP